MKHTHSSQKKTLATLFAVMLILCAALGGTFRFAETVSASDSTPVSASDSAAASTSDSETGADAAAMFTERDMKQTADLSDAVSYSLADGTDITITEAGVYVLSGSASDVTVFVEASDEDKVQLVLDGADITNSSAPCIYVKSADKVFVTTAENSSLSVTGSFTADGEIKTDGAIFSRSDLTLNGTAELAVSSADNGVVSKDDLKITGGTYTVTAASKAFEANDSIRIADGTFTVTAGTDGFHAENDEDDTLGYIYVENGTFFIRAGDDAIHALTRVQIENGEYEITASEGIEGTDILINDGSIAIEAMDDGINAAQKSSSLPAALTINGGNITVKMAAGDTDGIDSNGSLTITGGTIDVTGQSSFDIDGTIDFTGGTIIVNGQQMNSIPNQMMGGFGGRQPGPWASMNPQGRWQG